MQTIIDKARLDRLLGASANLQSLMTEGHLAAAFADQDADSVNRAVAAFDALAIATAAAQDDQKAASPFLRYRREIMAETRAGMALRSLVLSLFCIRGVELRLTFEEFGEHDARIALECMASFAMHGDRDRQFMSLAIEIVEAEAASEEAA